MIFLHRKRDGNFKYISSILGNHCDNEMINYQNVNENDNDRFNFVRIMNIQILNADYIVVKTIAEIPSSVGFFYDII